MRAHLAGVDDSLVSVRPALDRFPRFRELLETAPDDAATMALRAAETTGRPLGDARFLARLERRLGCALRPQKGGRKPAAEEGEGALAGDKADQLDN